MIRHVVVMTGAGISADSGVQTFRDAGGLWEGHRPEDVATPEAWLANPALVWRFYQARRAQLAEVEPNAAHFALIEERHSGTQQRQHGDGTAASAAIIEREVVPGFEPKDKVNELSSARSRSRQPQPQQHAPSHDQDPSDGVGSVVIEGLVPGVQHSRLGLAHDKMMGGVKGRRKSKKDKLREASAAKKAAEEAGR